MAPLISTYGRKKIVGPDASATHTRGPRGVCANGSAARLPEGRALDEQRARWRSLRPKGWQTSGAASTHLGTGRTRTQGRQHHQAHLEAQVEASGHEGAGRCDFSQADDYGPIGTLLLENALMASGRAVASPAKQVSVEGVLKPSV